MGVIISPFIVIFCNNRLTVKKGINVDLHKHLNLDVQLQKCKSGCYLIKKTIFLRQFLTKPHMSVLSNIGYAYICFQIAAELERKK